MRLLGIDGCRAGLQHPKKTPQGEQERLTLLRRVLPPFDLVEVRAHLGPANVGRDDILDAAACLVTTYRIATSQARVLPNADPPCDARGLRMEVVA
jgi:predicted RNase H-like nuclease